MKSVIDKFRSKDDEVPEAAAKAIGGASGSSLSPEFIEEVLWDLEVALYESDVAQDVVTALKASLKKELAGKRVERGHDKGKAVEGALRNSVRAILEADYFDLIQRAKEAQKPFVVMFVGVNGSGKTTTIARIATLMQASGLSVVMAAGDTFRAGAVEQLCIHGDKLGVKVVKHGPGADPAAVAFDAVEHAKARRKDIVLIDTAGRMQTNTNLMDQMSKVHRVSKPNLVIFVGDSLAGNDAVEQAVKFNKAVKIDAAILTKVDSDAKGGAALSIAHSIKVPIIYVGVGQDYKDLQAFNAEWMISRLFSTDGKTD